MKVREKFLANEAENIPAKQEAFGPNEIEVENDRGLENFVISKIAGIDAKTKDLEVSGRSVLETANKLIGLPPEKFDEIKKNSSVEKKINSIAEKAKKLANVAKEKLKMAVVIGMSTMALGGAGELGKAHVSDAGKDNVEITEKIANEDTLNDIKSAKNELEKHINSKAYLDKLKHEHTYTDPKFKWISRILNPTSQAEKLKKKRIENLEAVKTDVSSLKKLKEKYTKNTFFGKNDAQNLHGFYRPREHKIYIPNDEIGKEETIRHELGHAATRSNDHIPGKSIGILKDSYKTIDFGYDDDNDNNKYWNEYYSNPTERLVRKWAVDRDMEELGIKKYEEKFTQEHFEKLANAYNEGKFSDNAEEFIETTKPGFKHFEKIFNEIAKNEDPEKPLNA